LSNVIKAVTIKYDEDEKREVDTTHKSEELEKIYKEKIEKAERLEKSGKRKQTNNQDEEKKGEIEFEAGLDVKKINTDDNPRDRGKENQETCDTAAVTDSDISGPSGFVAQKLADDIVEEANTQAEKIIAKAESDAKLRADRILREAETKGYSEGKKKADAEASALKKEYENRLESLQKDYESKVLELEPKFAGLVIKYTKKLTGVVSDEKQGIVLYLIEQAFGDIEDTGNFLVHVSDEDYDIVNDHKSGLTEKLPENASIEIVKDKSLAKSQCYIETDGKIIDISLDSQLNNLIADIKLMADI
jgi:flagellar assembly protein FliH